MNDADFLKSWRIISIQAGEYIVNVGSTDKGDSLESMKTLAVKLMDKTKEFMTVLPKDYYDGDSDQDVV